MLSNPVIVSISCCFALTWISFDCPPMKPINFSAVNKMTILWFVFSLFNEPGWGAANLSWQPHNIPRAQWMTPLCWYFDTAYGHILRNGMTSHTTQTGIWSPKISQRHAKTDLWSTEFSLKMIVQKKTRPKDKLWSVPILYMTCIKCFHVLNKYFLLNQERRTVKIF